MLRNFSTKSKFIMKSGFPLLLKRCFDDKLKKHIFSHTRPCLVPPIQTYNKTTRVQI